VWLLVKSTLRKKKKSNNRHSATTNIYQKKLGRSLGRTKKSILKKSALLVRLIVNIMEEIETKSVKHNQRRLPGVIVL